MSSPKKIANKRLANKVIWNLEDIMAHCIGAWNAYQNAKDRAKARGDQVMIAHLSELGDHLAVIERKTRDARQGNYRE